MQPYSAVVLGSTGNVGRQIVNLLVASAALSQVVVVNRRQADAFKRMKYWWAHSNPPFAPEHKMSASPVVARPVMEGVIGHYLFERMSRGARPIGETS